MGMVVPVLDRGPDLGVPNLTLPRIGFEQDNETVAETDKDGTLSWNRTKHDNLVLTFRLNCLSHFSVCVLV